MENSNQNKFSKLEIFLAIAVIVLITIVAYGLLMKSFGYYSDEWYVAWAGRTSGPGLIVQMHQFDRPLMGYFYAFFYSVLGDNPLGWQVFTIFLRLLGVLAFWSTLRMLWPKSLLATTSVALLFAVYPGFMVMPKAIIKVNPIFTLACALISIAFTIKSAQVKGFWKAVVFHFLAFSFGTIYLFYVEYMVGLEFFRWSFLWIALKKRDKAITVKNHVNQWFLYAGPLLFVAIGMIVWRLFFFESGRNAMNVGGIMQNIVNAPLHSIAGLFIETGRDFIESAFSAWFVQGYAMSFSAPYRPWTISIILAILVIISFYGYSIITKKIPQNDQDDDEISYSFTWIGGLGVFAALFPLVIVGRQVLLDPAKFNKYSIHGSIGVSLMIVGLLLFFTHRRRAGLIVVVSLLLGLAIQTHYFNGLRYQDDWRYQKELWWQLTWRAPDLKDNTLLAARIPGKITLSESYEIWAPANIIYRPDSPDVKISGEIIVSETTGWFLRGITNKKKFRKVIPVVRNFNNTLIITIPNSLSCLHVIDGNQLEDYKEDPHVKLIFEKSQINQIITDTSTDIAPPLEIFGPEPEMKWCYYYQKISLERQRRDWETAAALADKASELGYKPLNPSEWLPVFETYVNLNRMDDAQELATEIRKDLDLQYLYCSQSWNKNNEAAYALMCENE